MFNEGVIDMRNKALRARTVKAARNHMVSVGGLLLAALLFIIGIAAFSGGYTNVGPVFIAFGAFMIFVSVIPVLDIPGWATAVITVGSFAVVIIFSMPYIDAMVVEFEAFMQELPTLILDWLNPF